MSAGNKLEIVVEADSLSLAFLDGHTVIFRGQPVDLGRKQGALLAYLALSEKGNVSRDRLIGILWSEHSAEKARRNLRQLWKKLRDALCELGFQGLEGSNDRYLCLDPSSIVVDVNEMLKPESAMNPPDLLMNHFRIHESLLSDFEGVDSEYDNWLLLQRHTFHNRLAHQLETALKQCKDDDTRRIAQALHNLDPSNEMAARRLMSLHAKQNNVAAALNVYRELSVLLDNEFGMSPTSETEELAVEIKLMDSAADQSPGTGVDRRNAPENTLAEIVVDRFNTELVPESQKYIADGFRHDLIASLARFRDWRVVEKSGTSISGKGLLATNNRYELRAQMYVDNAEMQLVFTVLDDSSAAIVWSDKYVLRMESWLSTQASIVRKLAVSLNVNLSANRLNAIWQHRELPAALHDRWLLGQSYIYQWTPESSAKASEIFQTINSEAPGFAPAFSGRVQIENSRHLVFPGLRRKSLDDQSTLRLARKAVQIDPLDSKAHLCMAWSHCLAGHFEEALRYFDSANEINENDPWIIVSTAQGYAFCDEIGRAVSLVQTANELNLSLSQIHSAYQVGTKFLCGDYRGAVESAEIAGDIISNIRAWKTAAYWHLGNAEEAMIEGQAFLVAHRERWYGKNKNPTDEEISDWLLHCFPIRSQEKWTLLREGLENSGIAIVKDTRSMHA